MHPFAYGTTRGSCAFQLRGEAGNWFKKEQAVPAFFIHYLGVREGRVMTKQRGPEDLSSCNCQVLLCCQMRSISCPILFLWSFESLGSWRMVLVWSDVGWEGTCLEETPAALQEQSHPDCPWLVRSGVEGGWGLQDAWPDVATKVACVVVPQRCLLMSFSLPSCTPCGGTRGHN